MNDARDALPFIEGLLRDAGAIHRKWFRNLGGPGNGDAIGKKGAIDLVTEADRESEALIAARIRAAFPDHRLLAEEGGGSDAPADDEWIWVVDPVDGTTNFAHGVPIFAASIALCRGRTPMAGGVHAEALGETHLAARGAGATRNGVPVRASSTATMQDALMSTGFPYSFGEDAERLVALYGAFLLASRGVLRLGSAAMDMAFVAAGNLDGFYEHSLKPWDTAAAALLVEEAGGRVTTWDGGPFDPWQPSIACSNGPLHGAILEVLARGG